MKFNSALKDPKRVDSISLKVNVIAQLEFELKDVQSSDLATTP